MKDLMQYKNYFGSVHFDDEELVLQRKIEFIIFQDREFTSLSFSSERLM